MLPYGDNDFVGFVFGYHNPQGIAPPDSYNFFLLDWKKTSGFSENNQYNGLAGFTLSKYNGTVPTDETEKYFWGHNNYQSDSKINILGMKHGSSYGWEIGTNYNFELDISQSRITVLLNDSLLFEIPGCFSPAKVGFYTYSSYNMVVSDFVYEPFVDFNILGDQFCMGDEVSCQLEDPDCPGATALLNSWTWDWGDGSTSSDTNGTHVYSYPDSYDISLYSEFSDGCKDTVVKQVSIAEPAIDFLVLPDHICVKDTFNCTTSLTSCPDSQVLPLQTKWDWGNGETSTGWTSSYSYDIAGTYLISDTAIFEGGYTSFASHTIIVSNEPEVFIGNDTTVDYYSSLSLSANNGPDAHYAWSNGDTLSSIIIKDIFSDTIVSVWVTVNGCSAYDEIRIHTVKPPESHFWMPNAFSPDQDGLNDSFKPVLSYPRISSYSMLIYNRWGQKIFSTTDYNEGWDGKISGKLCPAGIFVYKIIYDAPDDKNQLQTYEVKGTVLMLK